LGKMRQSFLIYSQNAIVQWKNVRILTALEIYMNA